MGYTNAVDTVVASLFVARSQADEQETIDQIDRAIHRIIDEWGHTGTVPSSDDPEQGSDAAGSGAADLHTETVPTLPRFAGELSVGLLLHDTDTGAILDANPAAEELYGYSAAKLREISVGEFSSEAPRFSQGAAESRIQEAVQQGKQSFEWQVRRANGEVRWVQVTLSAASIRGGDCVLAEVHDITEYKSRERRLGLLYRIIRHNLRNDMNLVLAHAEELREALESDELESQAATILDVARGIGQMTDSVRVIERFASGASPDLAPRNLRTVVEEIVADLEGEAPNSSLSVSGDDDVFVAGDDGLEMALREAIGNAVEHSPDEQTAVSVTIRADNPRPRAIAEIADENPRIPEMERNAILDHYDGSTTDHGSGVGLFVSKWCAESLGGDMEIRENEPKGNILRFVFPRLSSPTDR